MKKILLILICICLAQISQSQIPSYVPKDSLVGWWPFNGNANDESGNGHNGTVSGAVLTKDRFGNTNSAYYFNLFDYIETKYIGVQGNKPRTISFWLKNKNSNKNIRILMYGGNTFKGDNFTIKFNRNYQHDPCNCWPNTIEGIAIDAGNMQLMYNTKTGDSVNWHHYIYQVENNATNYRTIKIFKDGKLISNSSNIVFDYNNNSTKFNINTYTTTNLPVIFGKSEADKANTWGSQLDNASTEYLDDIAMWTRALDSNEIKGLFNSCSKKITAEPQNITTSNRFASFSCDANDTLQKFQWQKLVNSTWTNLKDSGQYSGSTTNRLFVDHLRKSNKNDQYRCQVSGSCLNLVTKVATLIYECKTQPKVIPKNYGLFGGNAFFVSNNNDTLVTYQWQTNQGTGWNNLFNAGQYSGVNDDTLMVENVSTSNSGQLFRCIISGDCGKDTSIEAKLSVWGVNTIKLNNDNIKLYPNPVKNLLEIDGYSGNTKIEIFNVSGQRILKIPFSRQIDVQSLNNGLYLLKLDNIQFKFIKE